MLAPLSFNSEGGEGWGLGSKLHGLKEASAQWPLPEPVITAEP